MTIIEAIDARHSVRAYQDKPIEQDTRQQLNGFVEKCNQESGLHIFIRYDDPDGFDSRLAHYGHFRNVKNYIVLAGKEMADFEFICGYYGEKIVLFAQQHELNTCWAALTFNKKTVRKLIPDGETLCMVIALGYGETQGVSRKSKAPQDVVEGTMDQPWFEKGIDAALKAPTAVNQQKFLFSMKDGAPFVKVKGWGSYTKVDLGIVAYHFEVASGKKVSH
jgi:nitroreductase